MDFDPEVLEREHPDLVIHEITERHLGDDCPASCRNQSSFRDIMIPGECSHGF